MSDNITIPKLAIEKYCKSNKHNLLNSDDIKDLEIFEKELIKEIKESESLKEFAKTDEAKKFIEKIMGVKNESII